MTPEDFRKTLTDSKPPADLSPILTALWHDARGDWEAAHSIAQDKEGTKSYDQLHAYLHRKEGDATNARYWYRRAGSPEFTGSLEAEWDALVTQFI